MDPISPTSTQTRAQSAVQEVFANSARAETDPATETPRKPTISSDFETFLKMLTVQMENQDPLNPIESSDYAVQLATFSNVEQQVLTNDLLTGLTEQLGATGLNQIAPWVGQRARVTAPVVPGSTPLTVVADTVTYADSAVLNVVRADGTILETLPIQPPGGEIEWTADPASGAAGRKVTFEVESFAAGNSLGAQPVAVYAPVREVRIQDGVAAVVLPGGETVPAAQITALREG